MSDTCTQLSVKVWTIVVAAGRSERFGRPKLLEEIAGKRVVEHSVATAVSSSDGVVLVADDPDIAADHPVDRVVPGGTSRSGSVRSGLGALPDDVDIVLVHDAARPAASQELFRRVVDAVRTGADAVVPGIPVVDTIKRVDATGRVVETPSRDELVAVQTPQGFRREALAAAHESGDDATDDAALIEQAGGTVVVVSGEATNLKLTTPRDLESLRAHLAGEA